MDFRAAKIILAVFLLIAFAIPFARIPRTAQHEPVRNETALSRLSSLSDSTSERFNAVRLTVK
jgi:hypothetical protein